jgi:nucleotide-binding universal stress UspA family protein
MPTVLPAFRGSDTRVPDSTHPTFRRAIVALNGAPSDARIVRLVAELGRPSKAEIVAVHVVEMTWSLPLDADIAGRSEEAQRVLDLAEAVAEETRQPLEPVLLQARDVAAALVDEAVERDADLLVVGLPYRTRFGGDFAIGRTIPYVLKNAPCAVWVVRDPMPEETA